MLGELGLFALILAAGFAALLSVLSLWGTHTAQRGLMSLAPPLALAMFSFAG